MKYVVGYKTRGDGHYLLFRHEELEEVFRPAYCPSEDFDRVTLITYDTKEEAVDVATKYSIDGAKISAFPVDGSTLHPSDKEAFETIDAMVFTGDSFRNPAHRLYFLEMMERWKKELDSIDTMEVKDG